MPATVAGAPVSFGVFELTPDSDDLILPTADQVCATLQETGYVGVDSGPIGFLGRGAELRERLERYGLELCGGWVDLPFSDDAAFAAALPTLDAALDVFTAVIETSPSRLPLPTLADSGDAIRKANPGGGAGHTLDADGWATLAKNVANAAGRIRDRGLKPTFHHHACTFVETPEEIDRFLEVTDVNLTFDSGHLLLGGVRHVLGQHRPAVRIEGVAGAAARVRLPDRVTGIGERGEGQPRGGGLDDGSEHVESGVEGRECGGERGIVGERQVDPSGAQLESVPLQAFPQLSAPAEEADGSGVDAHVAGLLKRGADLVCGGQDEVVGIGGQLEDAEADGGPGHGGRHVLSSVSDMSGQYCIVRAGFERGL